MFDTPRVYPVIAEYTPTPPPPLLFNKFICANLPESTPPSQNIPPFYQICLCDLPRIYSSLPEYTSFSTNLYVQPSQNLPLPPRILPFSTTVCDPPRIYPSLPEYNPFQQLYATFPEPTPPSQDITLLNNSNFATLPESTPPSQNISPLFNNCIRPSQNLPLPPRIYPPFKELLLCDPPRIYPPSRNTPPPFKKLHATLPESTPPSQNLPHFSTNLYGRATWNPLLSPRIYPRF